MRCAVSLFLEQEEEKKKETRKEIFYMQIQFFFFPLRKLQRKNIFILFFCLVLPYSFQDQLYFTISEFIDKL